MEDKNSNKTKDSRLIKLLDPTNFKDNFIRFLTFLYNHTIYAWLVKKTNDNKKYDIAGGYIILFICIFITLLSFYSIFRQLLFLYLVTLVATYRLYDLFITHLGNIIFKQNKGILYVRNPARFITYAILNFIEIIICLSSIKLFLEKPHWLNFSSSTADSIIDSIYFTTVTLVTLGYGEIHPINSAAKLFVIFEIIYVTAFLIFLFPIISSAITVKEEKNSNG